MKYTFIYCLVLSATFIAQPCVFAAAKISVQKETTLAVATKTAQKTTTDTSASKKKTDKKTNGSDTAESDEKRGASISDTLDYGIQEERIKVLHKIRQIKTDSVKSRLLARVIELMGDESDPEFLTKAIMLLGDMKETKAIPLFTKNMDHQSEEVRTAAVNALKNVNGISAKEKMIEKLKAQNFENTSNFLDALLNALAEFKAIEILPFAKETLTSDKTHRSVKENLILFIGKVQAKDAKEILLKFYQDDEEDITLRAYAVNALSKLGFADTAPQIKEIIKTIESYDLKKRKKYFTLHLYSVAALARLGDTDAVPKLVQALRSNNADMRLKAINLIKEFNDKRTIDILQYKMKYDQNPKVRSAAKKALVELGVDVKEEKKERAK